MKEYLKQSRITKALTDRANGAATFPTAEGCLTGIRVTIVVMPDQVVTAAGQAAALTAVNAGFKCFGNVTLVGDTNSALLMALPIGKTIGEAAMILGATVAATVPSETTHLIGIGDVSQSGTDAFIRCWWNGWTAGVVPRWDDRLIGASGNPLAGVFSGALAVREVFASVLGYSRCGSRVSVVSMWEPGSDPETADPGPNLVYVPPRLWFIGLGHLGQGILWCLGLVPIREFEAVLQDDQKAGEENEATGLLTRGDDIGQRKTRIAAKWLDRPGWSTRLIERRHYGDIRLLESDPCIVITSLDEPGARIQIANGDYEYLIDAGIGHGPVDFESSQIRVLKKGVDPRVFWSSSETPKNVDILLEQIAYRTHDAESDQCGARTLANASVAVPFVGAAVGALVVAQAIRLASMKTTMQMMQMELGAPGMALVGATNPAALESRGSVEVRFARA